jgi:O-antigen ligase
MAVREHQARAATAGRTIHLSLPASVVLAAALPILFLHVDYQPGFTLHTGSAHEHIVLSDFVLLAVGVTALVAGLRRGFAPLRPGLPIWIAGAIFLLDVFAASVYPKLWASSYESATHAVTAAKFAEYALLALSVPLLVRTRRDAQWVVGALVAWSVVATIVGIAQIFGADILEAWAAGRRQPSFLGHHDFAALSGAALVVCLVGIALRPVWRPRTAVLVAAGISGVIGIVISASVADAAGLAIAAAALVLAAWLRHWIDLRRGLAIGGITLVVLGGVFVMRAGEINQFLRFVGIGQTQRQNGVESYVQRTMLVYIGWRIFEDNPIGGAGWQASTEQRVYGPYLPAAHREFPGTPALAFPSPQHPWGVQNAFVQAMSDLGIVGLLTFLGLLATGLFVAARAALRSPPAVAVTALVSVMWLVLVMGVLSALGLVAGIPSDALLWLALGFAVVAAGGRELVRARD